MPVIDAGGWTLAYDDEGSGPPVFLLHGILMNRTMFDAQAEALRDRYRVIRPDAPGHGSSPARPVGFTLEDHASALAALAEAVGAGEPSVWTGHSMGGMAAVRVAIAHPELVRALVLIDTQPYPEQPEPKAQYDAMIEVAKSMGVTADLAAAIGTIMFAGDFATATDEGRRWVEEWTRLDGSSIEGQARAVFDRDDISGRLGEIRVPCLLVHGADDTPIPVEIARDAVKLFPDAELVEIDGAGHQSPNERPTEVTAAIERFLARI